MMMRTEGNQRASILVTQKLGHCGAFHVLSVQEPRFIVRFEILKQSPSERHRSLSRQQAEL